MTEETKRRHSGRRREREPGTYQRVTLEFPVELWHLIGERSKNRTQWLIDAAQEKIEKTRKGQSEEAFRELHKS